MIQSITELKEVLKSDANVYQSKSKWVQNLYLFVDYQMKILASIDRNLIPHFPYWLLFCDVF